jgi:hypothetical protein
LDTTGINFVSSKGVTLRPSAVSDEIETAKAGIRLRYPEADQREVFRAAASRVSRELMIRAHGWDQLELHVVTG